MNILIAFGSTEGHTSKIAHHINALVQAKGHSSMIYDCGSMEQKSDLSSYDGIIVAGSVHQEVHQPSVVNFVKENLTALKSNPTAFVSVSLQASLENGKVEAERYVDKFLKETNWQPQNTHMAAGAIRFLEYDFFKRFTIEHMVLKGKEMPDKSAGNPEYTDWDALDAFVEAFLESAICK